MKIKIKVTKEILKRSMNCELMEGSRTTNCAISLAVREIFPEAETMLRVIYPSVITYEKIEIPQEAQDFIVIFDRKDPEARALMTPIEFEVELTDEVIEALPINIDEAKEILKNSSTLELVD